MGFWRGCGRVRGRKGVLELLRGWPHVPQCFVTFAKRDACPIHPSPVMTYPFGAAKADLEKVFALPAASAEHETEDLKDDRWSESERAVALFELPDH